MKANVLTLFLILSMAISAFSQELKTVELPGELDRVLRDYEKYWTAKDEKGLAGLFTEDGFILRPGHPPVRGRENIEESYKNSGGPLYLVAYDYVINGNLGIILGGFSGDPNSPPGGKFTLTLKLVGDRWLIHSDMDNGNRR